MTTATTEVAKHLQDILNFRKKAATPGGGVPQQQTALKWFNYAAQNTFRAEFQGVTYEQFRLPCGGICYIIENMGPDGNGPEKGLTMQQMAGVPNGPAQFYKRTADYLIYVSSGDTPNFGEPDVCVGWLAHTIGRNQKPQLRGKCLFGAPILFRNEIRPGTSQNPANLAILNLSFGVPENSVPGMQALGGVHAPEADTSARNVTSPVVDAVSGSEAESSTRGVEPPPGPPSMGPAEEADKFPDPEEGKKIE